ncbi:hypothetical protein Tco_1441888 [Tanacetum coccineum]
MDVLNPVFRHHHTHHRPTTFIISSLVITHKKPIFIWPRKCHISVICCSSSTSSQSPEVGSGETAESCVNLGLTLFSKGRFKRISFSEFRLPQEGKSLPTQPTMGIPVIVYDHFPATTTTFGGLRYQTESETHACPSGAAMAITRGADATTRGLMRHYGWSIHLGHFGVIYNSNSSIGKKDDLTCHLIVK